MNKNSKWLEIAEQAIAKGREPYGNCWGDHGKKETFPNFQIEKRQPSELVFGKQEARVTSLHGTRLRGFPDGHVDLTDNNNTWETWSVIDLGDNRFNLKSFHGTFLQGNMNGTVDLAEVALTWEVWIKETHGDK